MPVLPSTNHFQLPHHLRDVNTTSATFYNASSPVLPTSNTTERPTHSDDSTAPLAVIPGIVFGLVVVTLLLSCVLPHKLGRWLEARETRLKLADIAQVARVVTHKDWKAEHATLGNHDKVFVAEQDVW